MNNTLYVMSGCPGSGKTTYAKKVLTNATYISRDEIRFSLLTDKDAYFSKEKLVYDVFINRIQNALNAGENVVADATHLNSSSRTKLFRRLRIDRNKTNIIVICMVTPLEVCIQHNEKRRGSRAYVPVVELEKMFNHCTLPSYAERETFMDAVRIVRYNGEIEL